MDLYKEKYIKYKQLYLDSKVGGADYNSDVWTQDLYESHNQVEHSINVATWNILADGLSYGEFLCDQGDASVTSWNIRQPKIVLTIGQMLENGVDLVCTQENDHPELILKHLQSQFPLQKIEMIKIDKYSKPESASNVKIGLKPRLAFAQKKKYPLYKEDSKKQPIIQGHDLDKTLKCQNLPNPPFHPDQCPVSKDEVSGIPFLNGKPDIQNDSLTIYYNSDFLEQYSDVQSIPISKKSLAGLVKFKHIESGKIIKIVNAHLSSGEEAKKASVRLEETENLLKGVSMDGSINNTIILMDSNSSNQYPGPDGDRNYDIVLEVLKDKYFTDLLQGSNNECYKMRHGNGGQPKKFGLLMYDQIDKIAISPNLSGESRSLSEFTTAFTKVTELLEPKTLNYIKTLKNNEQLRNKLKDLCEKQQWSDKVGQCVVEGKPNKTIFRIPKGDPYLTQTSIGYCPDNNILPQELQRLLYPNVNCASDHPPCIATIYL